MIRKTCLNIEILMDFDTFSSFSWSIYKSPALEFKAIKKKKKKIGNLLRFKEKIWREYQKSFMEGIFLKNFCFHIFFLVNRMFSESYSWLYIYGYQFSTENVTTKGFRSDLKYSSDCHISWQLKHNFWKEPCVQKKRLVLWEGLSSIAMEGLGRDHLTNNLTRNKTPPIIYPLYPKLISKASCKWRLWKMIFVLKEQTLFFSCRA